jgi:hypothetical protein
MDPFTEKHWDWALRARELLEPFRDLDGCTLSRTRTDRLQQAICEALYEAYSQGRLSLK